MQLHFINIPYSVILPNGELVEDRYLGHNPLVYEFCEVSMNIWIVPNGAQYYEHVLPGANALPKKPVTVLIATNLLAVSNAIMRLKNSDIRPGTIPDRLNGW